jgi:alpha-D-ribose 1-methylphosphonate 5-triphosphate synthase subunit PhnH
MAHTTLTSAISDPAAARLGGVRSQRAFAALLATLSRPGTIEALDAVALPADVPPALVVPLALADVEVEVAVVDDRPDAAWERFLVDVTGARPAAIERAGMVVFISAPGRDQLLSVRRGRAESPEGGAKVAIAVDHLRAPDSADREPDELVVELSGPGVDGSALLAVTGLSAAALDAISQANRGFPSGFDTWLVARDGSLAAISRSTRLALADPTEVS